MEGISPCKRLTRSLQTTPDGALISAFADHVVGPACVSSNVRQKMIEDSIQLGSVLKSTASRLRASCRFDTHFQAHNWELSWWAGRSLHRHDFQPDGARGVTVTHYEDGFRALPRLLRWAHSAVPYFPYLARIELRSSASISLPIGEREVIDLVDRTVSAAKGSR